MAILVDVTTFPQTFTSGNFPLSTLNDGDWEITFTFTNALSSFVTGGNYFALVVCNDLGGLWLFDDGGTKRIALFQNVSGSPIIVQSSGLVSSAGSSIKVRVENTADRMILSGSAGFTSGAGTYSFTGSTTGDAFGTAPLGVGVYGGGGYTWSGSASDIEDGVTAASGAGLSAGTSTVTGVGASLAAAIGSAAGTSTAEGVAPSNSGAGSAAGTSTVTGVGASIAAAAGSAAGTSTVAGVSAGDPEIGVGAIVQRINSVNPATGTLSTWSTDLTLGSVDTSTDTVTISGHGFDVNTEPGPFYLTTTGTLPGGLSTATPYWLTIPTTSTVRFASSMPNATAGTIIDLTSAGSGTHTLVRTIDTQSSGSAIVTGVARGVWSTDSSAATDNKSNDFPDYDQNYAYANFPGSRVRMRVDVSATGGTAHTVSATWGDIGGSGDEITAVLLEIKNASILKASAHTEVAVGSATITAPTLNSNAAATFVYFLWGNGPVNQNHVWTPSDANWIKHVGASAEGDTSPNGYIQCTVFSRSYSSQQIGVAPTFSGTSNEGAQIFGFVFQAVDPPSVGQADGTSLALGAGAALVAGAGSAAGTSTAAAVGSAAVGGVGASEGTATVAGVGASTAAGAGASDGSATASGVGAATSAAAGASDGTGTAAAVGAATAAADGAAAGTSTVAATGAAAVAGAGAAAGTSTVAGVGASLVAGAGATSGAATVAGVGASLAAGAGASAGTSTVTGAGDSQSSGLATGSAAGTSTAVGIGASIVAAIGTAAGTSTASGVSSAANQNATTTVAAIRAALYAQLAALSPTVQAGTGYVPHREDAGDLRTWAAANPPAALRRFELQAVGAATPAEVSKPGAELVRQIFELIVAYPTSNRFGSIHGLHDAIASDLRLIDYHLGTTRGAAIDGATVTSRGYTREAGESRVLFGVLPLSVAYWRAAR